MNPKGRFVESIVDMEDGDLLVMGRRIVIVYLVQVLVQVVAVMVVAVCTSTWYRTLLVSL